MRFTVHTGKGKTPFELHHGRKPRTKLTNLINKQTSLLSDWKSICDLENPGRLPVYITRRQKWQCLGLSDNGEEGRQSSQQ